MPILSLKSPSRESMSLRRAGSESPLSCPNAAASWAVTRISLAPPARNESNLLRRASWS